MPTLRAAAPRRPSAAVLLPALATMTLALRPVAAPAQGTPGAPGNTAADTARAPTPLNSRSRVPASSLANV